MIEEITVIEASKALGITTECLYTRRRRGKLNIRNGKTIHERWISIEDFEKLKNEKVPKGMKRCKECGLEDTKDKFAENRWVCISCWIPIKNLNSRLNKRKITLKEFDTMKEKCNNKCEICKIDFNENNLFIDHDHITGKVRGLLCNKCNTGLGQFDDNDNLVEIALKYLRQYKII